MNPRLALAALALFPVSAYAATLYNNGAFINSPGAGPSGSDLSVVQTTTLGMGTIGFGAQTTSGNRVADDFTVGPGGWDVTGFTFYAYQTGSTTTSTFTGATMRLWSGAPNAGGTILWGDSTTNVLTSSTWSNAYRVTDTTLSNTTRPVMANEIATVLHLGPGTYWLDVSFSGSLGSGPFAVPVTLNGTAITGNGLQYIGGSGSWVNLVDGGTGTPAQGLPFLVSGTTSTVPEPSTYALTALGAAALAALKRRRA